MSQTYVPRLVNLTRQDYLTVQSLAKEKGLGGKGFSAALRIIIREWAALTSRRLVDGPIEPYNTQPLDR